MNIAYYARRLQDSLDLAQESTDSCARLAHQGFARLYRAQLEELCNTADIDDGAVSLERPKAAG